MEALVTSFVAALLAGWSDKTQSVVAMLAETAKRPLLLFAGLLLALAASNIVAAIAGAFIAEQINVRAQTLLLALALLFAGASGLIRRRPPRPATTRLPLLTAFILVLATELGDRTQFLTFAIAGRFDSIPLAAAGATAGALAACLPALVLGEALHRAVPMRALRYAGAALFLLAGFVAAVNALQLT
ncbi:MAG TPA: TMEM165/GDT1 family protein [Allosphingosinicella sp.]|nr:TMEM165/GDT1 family protein [Allosphingosinicella sp.]